MACPTGLKPLPEGVTVHLACHARAQNMGPKAAEMLRLIPDTPVDVIERCSGHGGTFGVVKQTHEVAVKIGRPVFRAAAAQSRGAHRVGLPAGGAAHLAERQARLAAKDGKETKARAAGTSDPDLRPRLWIGGVTLMPATTARSRPPISSPYEKYAAERAEFRKNIIPMKKNRRIEVGPFATFYFENYDTMWMQVQEMLHIEKGGAEQIAGELEAYNPLIPQGCELIATLMLEIEDPVRRNARTACGSPASRRASISRLGERAHSRHADRI